MESLFFRSRDALLQTQPTDGRFLLALGHETRGLPEEWLHRGTVFTLPVHIESLGVAAAGAIMLDRLTEGFGFDQENE
jgi:tRNA G18 (ribose-2'-O)-methylase SpoU